jgi:organic hydroperoxide reductase OsmC/OhrA
MLHEYRATVLWMRRDDVFTDGKYSRGHVWRLDGVEVPASSSFQSVPAPYSVAQAVDPEEALVAALSSCHMLFFLAFAAQRGFAVDRYEDEAVGVMTRDERGKLFMSRITLTPMITFSGQNEPQKSDVETLHGRAHDECYVANSIRSEVVIHAQAPVFVRLP